MLNTTSKTLIKMAAMVWYTGVVVLVSKSGALFFEAYQNQADQLSVLAGIICGVVIGKIKAKYLFYNICKKNIDRINALATPRLWQFYRKRFFVFLFLMVTLGKYLSYVAHGKNFALLAVAILELSIAFALLLSSHCFWEQKRKNNE